MPGTAAISTPRFGNEALRKGYDQITSSADAPLATACGYLIRHSEPQGRARFAPGADNVIEPVARHLSRISPAARWKV